MPPFLPTKRIREESPPHPQPAKRSRVASAARSLTKVGQNLYEALDATSNGIQTVADRRRMLKRDTVDGESESSDGESDSDVDSDEFEDVAHTTATKTRNNHETTQRDTAFSSDNSDDSDEDEFEDVHQSSHHQTDSRRHRHRAEEPDLDTSIGDISIDIPAPGTLPTDDGRLAFSDARGVVGKKGPSKIERQIRQNTHCMHVQFLMFHNTIRNAWCQDEVVQQTLLKQLPQALHKEVTRWKKALGGNNKAAPDMRNPPVRPKRGKGKGRSHSTSAPTQDDDDLKLLRDLIPTRNEYDDRALRDRIRDWGAEAEPLEGGDPDLSYGDPTVRLLRYLASYWRKRFLITKPSLHKRGYLSVKDLETEVKAWMQQQDDAERFGERIKSKEEFRQAAKSCEGSRDVGAQLFTALLRGVGLKARMVVSLQPAGFGFGKVEEGEPYKSTAAASKTKSKDHAAFTPAALKKGIDMKKSVRQLKQAPNLEPPPKGKSTRGSTNTAPISLDTSSSDGLSDAPSDLSSDPSVMDITPFRKPGKVYEAPPMPTYWTEVLSPITQSILPVVSLPQPLIANSPELLASFTPSGKVAEKSKQVLAYIVAYDADGTAKDVTIRYLKKKQWPGKTRGVRIQKEKIPIYNNRGKVKKWIEWDWFHEVMSGYTKDPRLRSLAEKTEDDVDLVATAATVDESKGGPAKGHVGGKPESLQAYKNSADYVLERHLRREEAIPTGAEPVRNFTSGKGDNAKTEPVYRRADVITGMTVESWHKQGRAVKEGEQPIKMVPVRAVTLIRKREVEDAQRETGEKPMQGLYSESQTDWIIPDPIGADRKIPKNAFGNIDIYVPSMVPEGAVHVRLKGTAKLCKKMGIDFAEAVTGFEFGKQRAVPVITGVVVAEEHEGLVRDAWRAEQQRVKERNRLKRQAACLAVWKKFLGSMKVLERMRGDYGHIEKADEDEINPWMNKKAREQARKARVPESTANNANHHVHSSPALENDDSVGAFSLSDESGGGFIPDGMEVEEVRPQQPNRGNLNAVKCDGGGFIREESMFETSHAQPTDQSTEPGIDSDAPVQTMPSPPSKGNRLSKKRAGGLSKRVAEARNFDHKAGGKGKPLKSNSGKRQSITEGVVAGSASSQVEGHTAPQHVEAATAVRKSRRAVPNRRAAKDVRSRYFDSDVSTADR